MCKEFKGLGKVKREIVGFLVEREGRILNWLASVFVGKALILLEFWVLDGQANEVLQVAERGGGGGRKNIFWGRGVREVRI